LATARTISSSAGKRGGTIDFGWGAVNSFRVAWRSDLRSDYPDYRNLGRRQTSARQCQVASLATIMWGSCDSFRKMSTPLGLVSFSDEMCPSGPANASHDAGSGSPLSQHIAIISCANPRARRALPS
jgi:hypothetical protein